MKRLFVVLTVLAISLNLVACGGGSGQTPPYVAGIQTVQAPDAPTDVVAIAGDSQATITFNAPVSNGGSSITGYTITSAPGSITVTGTGSPITITGLSNGTVYNFTVTALNSVGTSPPAISNSILPKDPSAKWMADGDVTQTTTDGTDQFMAVEKDAKIFVSKYVGGFPVWESPCMSGKNFFAKAILAPQNQDVLILIAIDGGFGGQNLYGDIYIAKIRKSNGALLGVKSIKARRFLDVKMVQGEAKYQLLFSSRSNFCLFTLDFDGNDVAPPLTIPTYWGIYSHVEANADNVFAGGELDSSNSRIIILMLSRNLENPLINNNPVDISGRTEDIIFTPAGKLFVSASSSGITNPNGYKTTLFQVALETGDYTQVAQIDGGQLRNLVTDSQNNIYGIFYRYPNAGNDLYKFDGTTLMKIATLPTGDTTGIQVGADGNIFVTYRSTAFYSYPNVRLAVYDANGTRLN